MSCDSDRRGLRAEGSDSAERAAVPGVVTVAASSIILQVPHRRRQDLAASSLISLHRPISMVRLVWLIVDLLIGQNW